MPDEDVQQQILGEIRRLRRTNQYASVIALLLLLATSAYLLLRLPARSKSEWAEVTGAMGRSDYTAALRLAQKQAALHPADYYGHEYLGNIHLALGDVELAEKEYARAYELFPSENLKATLETVRKRRADEKAKTR